MTTQKVRLGPSLARTIANREHAADHIIKPRLVDWVRNHADGGYDYDVLVSLVLPLSEPPQVRSKRFGASSAGGCTRAQVLSFLGAPGYPPDASLMDVFDDGHWRHIRLQSQCLSAGIIDIAELWVAMPEFNLAGQVDATGVVPDDHVRTEWRGKRFGVEFKGANTWPFKKMENDGPGRYFPQIARYFIATDWELFVVLVEDKNTQEKLEWVVDRSDPAMAAMIVDQIKELQAINAALGKKELPSMLPPCGRGTGPEFRDCTYGQSTTNTCHQMTERKKHANLWRLA